MAEYEAGAAAERAAGAERATAAQQGLSVAQFRLQNQQIEAKRLEEAKRKNALDLSAALKAQKSFASFAQGKNGTLLTNPTANGIAPAPVPGQKVLIGQ